MITCPWCGTTYTTFQTNCSNCGGTLPTPVRQPDWTPVQDSSPSYDPYSLPTPPLPPRQMPGSYILRKLLADGGGIVGLVFILNGLIFGLIGWVLIASVLTAPVGQIFAPLGGLFLISGVGLLAWRYNVAAKTLRVLRDGQHTLGKITHLEQNYYVRVNRRHPWTIEYRFNATGQEYNGKLTTLNNPGPGLQAGRPVYVLYIPDDPRLNTLYPPP